MRARLRDAFLGSIERKLLVGVLLVVLVPLLGTTFYGQAFTSRVLSQQATAAIQADLERRAERIEAYLQGVRGDVLYLSRLAPLRALLQARRARDATEMEKWRDAVGEAFAGFGTTHPEYYQIRYIGEDGLEVVRVNVRYGQAEIVPPSQLQRKSHRYYFVETMLLPEGELYISPVDLNREYGRIEVPFVPVIRYATPLFYKDGSRAGILIVNVYASEFLRYASGGDPEHMALADQDGYYMVHPDPSKAWGHPWDLGHNYRVQVEFPRQWPQILRPQSGVAQEADQVVVHVPVFPDSSNPQRFWVLLHVEPQAKLFASVHTFRVTAGSILIVALFAAWLMATFLARSIAEPIVSLKEAVRRFAVERRYRPITLRTRDELAALAEAFNEMAQAIEEHIGRMSGLHFAARRLAAALHQEEIGERAVQAAMHILPAEAAVLVVGEKLPSPSSHFWRGNPKWLNLVRSPSVQRAREKALCDAMWHVVEFLADDGTATYMCCAPVVPTRGPAGTLEVYGHDPRLAEASTGHLLASLATQVAIALDNARLYAELQQHRQRLQALLDRLIRAQEEERRRIAYDLHDGLLPRLVGVRLRLSSLRDATGLDQSVREVLQRVDAYLEAAIRDARRLMEGLRPALLDELGLGSAIEALVHEHAAEAGWEVEIRLAENLGHLPSALQIAAFRIVQEALNNVRKHAQARRVRVHARREHGHLVLEVEDDGQGFDPSSPQDGHHLGLVGMRERARLLGGECIITSAPGRGTLVRAVVPLEPSPARNKEEAR